MRPGPLFPVFLADQLGPYPTVTELPNDAPVGKRRLLAALFLELADAAGRRDGDDENLELGRRFLARETYLFWSSHLRRGSRADDARLQTLRSLVELSLLGSWVVLCAEPGTGAAMLRREREHKSVRHLRERLGRGDTALSSLAHRLPYFMEPEAGGRQLPDLRRAAAEVDSTGVFPDGLAEYLYHEFYRPLSDAVLHAAAAETRQTLGTMLGRSLQPRMNDVALSCIAMLACAISSGSGRPTGHLVGAIATWSARSAHPLWPPSFLRTMFVRELAERAGLAGMRSLARFGELVAATPLQRQPAEDQLQAALLLLRGSRIFPTSFFGTGAPPDPIACETLAAYGLAYAGHSELLVTLDGLDGRFFHHVEQMSDRHVLRAVLPASRELRRRPPRNRLRYRV